MIVLGLTGGLAMGKSTIAAMLKAKGVPVHNADDAVHRIYAGADTAQIEVRFPGSVIEGRVDRAKLASQLRGSEDWQALEQIVHPLVQSDRAQFHREKQANGAPLVVLDVPLLFETGMNTLCDAVLLASAPPQVQRERALSRAGMTQTKFDAILSRQMPDVDKRRLSHFVIKTDVPLEVTARQINGILRAYAGR